VQPLVLVPPVPGVLAFAVVPPVVGEFPPVAGGLPPVAGFPPAAGVPPFAGTTLVVFAVAPPSATTPAPPPWGETMPVFPPAAEMTPPEALIAPPDPEGAGVVPSQAPNRSVQATVVITTLRDCVIVRWAIYSMNYHPSKRAASNDACAGTQVLCG